jgi:rubrerythrin
MYHQFNANEILEMAAQIEKGGYQFYQKAANDVADAEIKVFLLDLAEMELGHEKVFSELKNQLTTKEKEAVVFDPNEETSAYLKALADTRVFYEKDIDTTSVEEVLKAALIAEKDSIVFYLGMQEMVSEGRGKTMIDNIIKEEMTHIKVIGNRLLKQQ